MTCSLSAFVSSVSAKGTLARIAGWTVQTAYAEGVVFLSPGSRSAPWVHESELRHYAEGVIQTEMQAGAGLFNAFGVCCLIGIYSQGALRDPGLRNVTPLAYAARGLLAKHHTDWCWNVDAFRAYASLPVSSSIENNVRVLVCRPAANSHFPLGSMLKFRGHAPRIDSR